MVGYLKKIYLACGLILFHFSGMSKKIINCPVVVAIGVKNSSIGNINIANFTNKFRRVSKI